MKYNKTITLNGERITNKQRKNLDAWREAWVQALESDEYQQTKGCLKDSIGFCCLGVLCDLAVKAGHGSWIGNNININEQWGKGLVPLSNKNSFSGQLLNGSNLTTLNDIHGYSFFQIAKVIRDRQVVLPNGIIL
jgi:hypothetical protein